jgi:predicted ATPase
MHFLRDAARDGLDHAVARRHGIGSIRRWSKTRPFNISIKASFENEDGKGSYQVSIASAGGEFSVLEEEATWTGEHPFPSRDHQGALFTFVYKRFGSKDIKIDIPSTGFVVPSEKISVPESELLITQIGASSFTIVSIFFKSLYDEIVSCGAYSIYPNKIREPQSISNSDVLFDDGTNLASIIRQMRVTTYRGNREQLTSAIRQVLPIVNEIRIESAGGFYVPVFRVKETVEGYAHELNMSQISDGTLRMLGMLTAFYQPKAPNRITLEEPEQMIHPGLLPVLIDSGRDYLEGSGHNQVLYTTHSPILLDMFKPSSIIGAIFEDGISKFSPMSKRQRQIVEDRLFSAGELLVAEGIMQ